MRESVRWIAIGGLCLVAAVGQGHEISYDGKICLCVGDVDENGKVDEADLQRILDCFQGECSWLDQGQPEDEECSEEYGCPEDLNHNHFVGRGDVRVALANWGDCPLDGDVNGDDVADEDDMFAVLEDLGNDCRPNLDYDERIGGNDVAIAEAVWGPHDDPHLGTDLDGNGELSIDEFMTVFESQGTLCRSDVNRDGRVDFEDYCQVCGDVGGDCSIIVCPPPADPPDPPDPLDD